MGKLETSHRMASDLTRYQREKVLKTPNLSKNAKVRKSHVEAASGSVQVPFNSISTLLKKRTLA